MKWVAILLTAALAGGSCFISGAFAGINVAFETYALSHDLVSAAAMYVLPFIWAFICGWLVSKRLKRGRPVILLAATLVVLGAAVGSLLIYVIASSRASYLMSHRQ